MKQFRVTIWRILSFLVLPAVSFGFISFVVILIYCTQGHVKDEILAAFIFLAIPTVVIPSVILRNYFRHDHLNSINKTGDPNVIQLNNNGDSILIEKSRIRLIVERSYPSTGTWFYCKYWIIYHNSKKYVISSLLISDVDMYELFGDQLFKRICKFIPVIHIEA